MLQQLNGQDATFIHMDIPQAGTHGTMIYLYDASSAARRPGFADIAAHLARRFDALPMFRRRLQRVPFDLDNPYWVEDENFDLTYHLRSVTLPAPGDWQQFCTLAAGIQSRALDLRRPPWEMFVVEGLDAVDWLPEGSFGVLTKVHHCAVDGTAFQELTRVLHDLVPGAAEVDPGPPAEPARSPSLMRLVSRTVAHNAAVPLNLTRPLLKVLPALAPKAARFYGGALLRNDVPVTRFNGKLSAERVFSSRVFVLDDIRTIRSAAPGATVNDVVLAIVSGALRSYLGAAGELPESSLVSILPMNTRQDDAEYTASGNNISFYRTALSTDLADPLERLRAIHAAATRSKVVAKAVGAREMTDISRHAPPATMAVAGKLLVASGLGGRGAAPLHHCAVSNVPGPKSPLYLQGAELVYWSCVAPITNGMGLGFAVTSVNGRLIISPTSCPEMVPDPEALCACLQHSFDELLTAAKEAS